MSNSIASPFWIPPTAKPLPRGSDGVGATGIVMEHEGRPVGAGVAGAEIDIEGDGEVLAHIDAPRRHRRAGLVACRRQGEDVRSPRSRSRAASAYIGERRA